MEIKVYHENRPVALVKIPDGMDTEEALEYAFRWTNNIEGSWTKGPEFDWNHEPIKNMDYNPNVTRLAELEEVDGMIYGLRSSMMGDVFEVVGGDRYRVAMLGFELLNKG
jgi:hypothetical protein